MHERRREPRVQVDLPVRVWGTDEHGAWFKQDAAARNISRSGALLAGLRQPLRSGDLIGVQYGANKARFRVVWVRDSDAGSMIQVAVHKVEEDECPWKELLPERQLPV
jgi:hypothetical protein